MISVDVKHEVSSSAGTLSSSQDKDTPSISFASLLHGASLNKDEKIVQNGALVLALVDEKISLDSKTQKADTLLALLQGDLTEEKALPLELNTNLTQTLNMSELKNLVFDAKKYLKSKILESSEFKKFEVKDLPKTLKGLVQVAEKFGIDISKITLSEIKPKEGFFNVDKQLNKLSSVTKKTEENVSSDLDDGELQRQLKNDDKRTHKLQDLKNVPLFKATTKTEHTTEEFVLTKLSQVETKIPTKKKADNALQKLLSGDKTLKQDTTLTADFTVASAKVIAPKVHADKLPSLESLLKGDTSPDASDVVKLDTLSANKADSFEVKLNEAKQLTKYLSQDVKTAIEDYKSPFTRVKVQLNPQRLGEVDLTIVQRGKNLHINLSSNNVAINTLAMNAQDLKVQLANNGINNASLNFNSNSQSDQPGANQQHQQRHSEQKAQDEYNYFDTQEENEEIVKSLEIVVPRYV